MFQKRLKFFRSILYLGDLLLVALSWLAAFVLRYLLRDAPAFLPLAEIDPVLTDYLLLLILVTAIFAVALPMTGLYRRPWATSSQVWWPVIRSSAVGVVLSVSLAYFLRPYGISRFVFLAFFILVSLALVAYRPLLRRIWRWVQREHGGEGVLVVGIEDLGRLVVGKIRKYPVLGLQLVGFLTRRPEMVGQQVDGLPVLGLYNQVGQVIRDHQVQVVIIALPLAAQDRIEEVLGGVGDEVVDIKIVPDLVRYISLSGSVEEFEGLAIVGVRGSPMEGWARVAKRSLDVLGSLLGIMVCGPLMGLIALGVKLSSPGPVLFRQQRMGLDGRVFDMLKFRSMRQDAEADCGPVWASPNDNRCTPLGNLLRRSSLDELPQLVNVLKGEMSLVGPRPERPEFISEFRRRVPGYMLRHKMKAGLTGWAQINGWRGNTSLEPRIDHDLYYIENWSLGFDLKIMVLTLFKGFFHPHAY